MTGALITFVAIVSILIGGAIWRSKRAHRYAPTPYLETEDDSFLYDHAESRGE